MVRKSTDRILALVAGLLVFGFFRSVEIEGREQLPQGRPALIVANHFNGFVDPVLLVRVLGRTPRFLAKAALWRVWIARPFYALAGLIPVYRPQDGTVGSTTVAGGNRHMFAATHEALRNGSVVAVFPEGTTHDAPRLAPLRTGAARMALSARHAGVGGLVIVPVGLSYDNKTALRDRALVRVGRPIDLDAEVGGFVRPGQADDDSNQDVVRSLTAAINKGLREVTPDYDSAEERRALGFAAEVTLREPAPGAHADLAMSVVERIAQHLGMLAPDQRDSVLNASGRYAMDLYLLRLRDWQVAVTNSVSWWLRRLVGAVLATALLVVIGAPGLVVGVAPAVLVAAAGRAVSAPVTKGTVRLLTALVVFPAAWIIAAVLTEPRWWSRVLAVLVFIVSGAAAVAALQWWSYATRELAGWNARLKRRAFLDVAFERRAAVANAVTAALGAQPPIGEMPTSTEPAPPTPAWPADVS